MKNTLSYFLILFLFASCGEYQKALKSDDISQKVQVANDLYEAGKYTKALTLYEQVAPSQKGKPSSERFFYFMSMAYYKTKQYYLAGYGFENFSSTYIKSDKREEALFLSAECYYKRAPIYSLEQVDTYKALEKLQNFIDTYPNSEYTTKANEYVATLNYNLEKKAFEIAKQYNTIAEWARDFKAPIVVLDNFIADYPGTPFKEDALFYKFDALYKLATNSIDSKKEERLQSAASAYDALLKFKADTKFKKEADKMLENIQKELKQFANQ